MSARPPAPADHKPENVLVTGGCGFIGSNYIRCLLAEDPGVKVRNLDALTYAGNPENLRDVERLHPDRYEFIHGDIRDPATVEQAIRDRDTVVHFAAESHVDRSIASARDFITTNFEGTYVMLESARRAGVKKFLHISTDEVYGSIDDGSFGEPDRLCPSSPYSASKAAADLLALSYWTTHGFPVVISRSTNNFGPYQFPEKLIPLFVTNLIERRKVPLYGDGLNVRDWIYVLDNCDALNKVLRHGRPGEVYNVGAGNEVSNRFITDSILTLLETGEEMIEYVTDRLGHDRRYSVDTTKLRALGWEPAHRLEDAFGETVRWYALNQDWWRPLKARAAI